jgi:hypothetical protein
MKKTLYHVIMINDKGKVEAAYEFAADNRFPPSRSFYELKPDLVGTTRFVIVFPADTKFELITKKDG